MAFEEEEKLSVSFLNDLALSTFKENCISPKILKGNTIYLKSWYDINLRGTLVRNLLK